MARCVTGAGWPRETAPGIGPESVPPNPGGLLAAVRRNTEQRLAAAKTTAIARLAPMAGALLLAVALTSCGGGKSTAVGKTTTTAHAKGDVKPYVDIYAGLPLSGPMAAEGRAVRQGIRLARDYQRSRPGDLHIKFKFLNNAGQKSGDDNLALTAKHAGQVATDPYAVYYIGDLSSAATEVSQSVLNTAGVAQMTPGDPYIAPLPSGAAAPKPKLLRLLPSYTVQAAADVLFFKAIPPNIRDDACPRIAAFAQDDPESIALVNQMYSDAKIEPKADAMQMQPPTLLASNGSLSSAQLTALQHLSPLTCGFVIAGSQAKPAVKLTKEIHSLFPHAFIVGTSGLCTPPASKWTKAVVRQIPAIADSLLWCTSPVLPLNQYWGGAEFESLYKSTYHVSDPSPYAFYGYEAAELGITVVNNLVADGDNRDLVRYDLLDVVGSQFVPNGPMATIVHNYDTRDTYGVYRVSPQTGEPGTETTLRP
jgi:branched-chain amino acid transport system substrate-binding protein